MRISIFMLVLFVLALLVQGQNLFSTEEVAVIEEELAEEEQILEDRAGVTPDSPLYVVDEVAENIIIALKTGEDKAAYAVKVKEEKIAEAYVMVGEQQAAGVHTALGKAGDLSNVIVEQVGTEFNDLALESSGISKEILEELQQRLPPQEEWDRINALIDSQLTQEERIAAASQFVDKLMSYCDELAKLDFRLMEQDQHCDPVQAPEWLQGYIEEDITQRQQQAEVQLIQMITTCINDPRQCDCSQIPVKSEQNECQQSTELAIRCEYDQDTAACEELESRSLAAPSALPDFLKPAFEETLTELIEKKKKEMFAKFAPPECVQAGVETREECEEIMMEKYLPQECKDAGATTKEDCMELMQETYGIMPEECRGDDTPITREECMQLMSEKYDIPDECIREGEFLGQEECLAIMLPPECKEAGATTKEACAEVFQQKKASELDIGGGPLPECMQDGVFIGMSECQQIMQETIAASIGGLEILTAEGLAQAQEAIASFEQGGLPERASIPDFVLVINPETGQAEQISQEELQQIVEEHRAGAEGEIVITPEAQQLLEEVEELQQIRETGVVEEREEVQVSEEVSEESGEEETEAEEGEQEESNAGE